MTALLVAPLASPAVPAGAASAPPVAATVTQATGTYGPYALQTVTVYSGAHPNGRTVVMVHGGGFNSTAKDATKLTGNAGPLVADGDTVFDVNYRDDTGGVGIAEQVSDVVAGIEWSMAAAPTYGADPGALSVIGGSSGGLLVADAAEILNDQAPGTVRTVVTLSSPADFTSALAYWITLGGSLAQLHIKDLTGTLGCTVTKAKHVKTYDCPAALETEYSPDQQVTSANCTDQWLILNGTDEDQPTAQAVAMDDALAAAGCPQTLDIFPDTAHGYDYWNVVLPLVRAAIATT